MDDRAAALRRAAELGIEFLDGLSERHVGPREDAATVAERLGGPVPEDGTDAVTVIEQLAEAVDPGLVATAGPRYFGFVVGGAAESGGAIVHPADPTARR